MTNGTKKRKRRVRVGNGLTTISNPPAEIHIIYESDFESKPLWQIGRKKKNKATGKWMTIGLGSWAEDKGPEWKKKDLRDTRRIKGLFLEIDSVKTNKGLYVLIEHEGKKKWVNAGKVKPGQKCGPGDKKCQCEYRLKYRNATCYGPQYGARGSVTVRYGGETLDDLKLLALRYKTHVENKNGKLATGKNGKLAKGWPYVGPGLYKGLVLPSEHHEEKYHVPVIWIHETRDEDKGEWIKGCWLTERTTMKWKRKKGGKPKTSKSILIHPTNFPWKLEGCLALGRNFSDYGFVSSKDSRDAILDVFKLIWHASSKDELFKKLRKLTKSERLKFIIEVTDIRSDTLIEKVEGPEEVAVGCTAVFRATRKEKEKKEKAEAGKTTPINWVVRDSKTRAVLEYYGNTEGDELKIDCVPETWKDPGTVQVFAYTADPSDGVSLSDKDGNIVSVKVTSTGVGRFIALVRKVEEAYSTWNGDQVLNSLRRCSIPSKEVEVTVPTKTLRFDRRGRVVPYTVKKVVYTKPVYDTRVWQRMLDLGSAADLNPRGALTQKDLEALREMIQHEFVHPSKTKLKEKRKKRRAAKEEKGIAEDWFGNEVAMGHVLTGISAGQRRYTKRNMVKEMGYRKSAALGLGAEVDNLYASTISGDLGQSAVEVNEGRKKEYIGPKSESTHAELIGDIDGFLIGNNLDKITGGKHRLLEHGEKRAKLSEVLQKYYCMCDSPKICAAFRFEQFSKKENMGTWEKLREETKNFADTFVYFTEMKDRDSKFWGGLDGLTSTLKGPVGEAVEKFKRWLGKKKQQEAKRNKSKKH